MAPASVCCRRLADDQALLFERAQYAAEVASVQAQILADFDGRGLVPVGEFVENANFGEGKGAAQQPFLENTDLPGVEAVEVSHESDGGRGWLTCWAFHGVPRKRWAVSNYQQNS